MMTATRAVTVGHLAGVRIRIHWTWIPVAVLLTSSVACFGLPVLQPTWGASLRWEVAAVIAALFFLSLTLHELAHALAARERGLPVISITLFLFGGVAAIGDEPRTAKDEFVIAVVGPLASFTLMFLFAALYEGAALTGMPVVATVAVYLAGVNLFIGAFNLLPGYPLDGGRMLRACIWGLRHNFQGATKLAGYAGRVVSGGLMAGGIALVLAGAIGGAWLAFIGFFLWNAAVPAKTTRATA